MTRSKVNSNKKIQKKKNTKQSKYLKVFIERFKCGDCNFNWTYKTVKCPLCYCSGVVKLV